MAALCQQLSFAIIQKLTHYECVGVTLGFDEIGPKVFDLQYLARHPISNRPLPLG